MTQDFQPEFQPGNEAWYPHNAEEAAAARPAEPEPAADAPASAAPSQPAPQAPAPAFPPAYHGEALHRDKPAEAVRRAPFLEEKRPFSAEQQARAAAPAAPAVPPSDAGAAFAAAARENLPNQGAFMPAAEEPAEPEEAAKPAPPPVSKAIRTSTGPKAQPAGARVGMAQDRTEGDLDINAALRAMLKAGASDLHITSGSPPMLRLDGQLKALEGYSMLTPENLQRTMYSILTQKQRETFEEHLELDFSYAVVGEARFRVNLYMQRSSVGAAFRVIPYEIKPLEALGIPPAVSSFASKPRGLVLVTGPTGSGKSTTLASLIDLVNRQRAGHIMTVEDPIEFLHRHKKSLVNQREVGADTLSFGNALKHVLRQDPDVILVGEMRDLETIQVALTAAETGHLVFATLHTQDTAQTIDRIIDVFPAEQQAQVRTQLGTAIQGVVCQSLCKRSDGPGRSVAVEVMVATPAIRNLIREGKTHQIYSMLQAGSKQGMQTMDQHLANLVKQGRISYDTGAETCHHLEDFNRLCGRGQMMAEVP